MRSLRVFSILVLIGMVFSACTPAAPTAAPAKPAAPAAPAATTAPAAPAAAAKPASIKLGMYMPLTGALAFLGEGYKMGVELAIEDLGKKIEGIPIELITTDSKGTPTDSVNAVRKLIEVDKVLAIIGGGASSTTLAALPILLEGKTPAVDGSSTNATIYNMIGKGGNKYQFRIAPDDLIMGLGYADYISKAAKTVAFVGDDNQFGRGAGAVYKSTFTKTSAKMISEDYFDPATADYRPALTKIKASNPESVLIVMTEQSCATFMRQYREVGITAKVFSRGACTTGLFLDLIKDKPSIGEGIIEFSFFSEGQDKPFDKRFVDFYSKPPTGHRMAGYYIMRYTLAPAIGNVIKSGKELTRDNIRDAIAALDVTTPAGKIKFDEYNQAYTDGTLTTNEGGKVILKEVVPLKPIDHTGF